MLWSLNILVNNSCVVTVITFAIDSTNNCIKNSLSIPEGLLQLKINSYKTVIATYIHTFCVKKSQRLATKYTHEEYNK